MNLTDAEIMMVEQLSYFGNIDDGDKGKTIEMILSEYTDSKLNEMAASNSADADRAALIRYMKESNKIKNLVFHSTMKDKDNKTLALCFTDENHPEEALVAFKGTTSKEWGDNFEGLNSSDTERQLQAKDFIDKLPFENITVSGHSKGGNKAMYVAICCEKVNRCISMDGQGFSQEFIEKYQIEIFERATKIKNYSVSTDYVHVLLFQVPGSEQLYCEGFRIGNDIRRHHEPFSFFQIDNNGKIVCENDSPVVVTEKDGKPIAEDPSVVMLHQFTTYVLNVASPEEKEKIVNLIATSADMFMAEGCSAEEILNYLLNNPDNLSLVFAYLIKYMDTYDLDSGDIDGLLQMLGLKSLDGYLSFQLEGNTYGISDLVDLMKSNLTDGEDDPIINKLLNALSKLVKLRDLDFDFTAFWKSTEKKIHMIPNVSRADGIKEPQVTNKSFVNLTEFSHYIKVDTIKLKSYADRLKNINTRLVRLDEKMDRLYRQLGLKDLFTLMKADVLTGYSLSLSMCKKYLEDTATDFDNTEHKVIDQF